eukprot:15333657-Ditylum_brightwellii.AAC.2
MDKTYKYKAFKSLGKGGGRMTGTNTDTYYSSVVSLRSIKMMIFLAELNGVELIAADIGNAYLLCLGPTARPSPRGPTY